MKYFYFLLLILGFLGLIYSGYSIVYDLVKNDFWQILNPMTELKAAIIFWTTPTNWIILLVFIFSYWRLMIHIKK